MSTLPPPMFELEPDTEAPVIRRRPGHTIRVHNAPGRWFIACTCGDTSRTLTEPDSATRWAYQHLGIAYDTTIHDTIRGPYA